MEVIHPSHQNMDQIDILWHQDIDLGARREVFDYNHRQKEHELRRQRELEEEKRRHSLLEQQKLLLAQLQLDEETGEYIPRPPPAAPLQPPAAPLEVTQNDGFSVEDRDAMVLDAYLQILAETFSVGSTESSPVCFDNLPVSTAVSSIMTPPEQPVLSPATFPPSQLPQLQRTTPDLEQAWMELLSLPELQQCLNMQMEEMTTYPVSNSPEVQNYSFYPVSDLTDAKRNSPKVDATEFINMFDGPVPSVALPNEFDQMKAEVPQLNVTFSAESLCDMFYPNTPLEETSCQQDFEGNKSTIMPEIPNKAPFTPMDMCSLSPGDESDGDKQNLEEAPDLDSGISSNASPNASSPAKSVYGSGSFSNSDSEMTDMDHNPRSAESDYSEMFSINFEPDDFDLTAPAYALTGPSQPNEESHKQLRLDLAEDSGHHDAPFTKDKQKKRFDVRLSRDEQKAKALNIPFTVDTIINLPVDDFSELMSKQQLNEAQLNLVRDIRRRGKNKVAAQNCRKRKMENICGLETELDSLKEEKERLQNEKSQNMKTMKEMKQQLNSLYLEVFTMLKDEKGNSYSPSEYSLQQSTDGTVFLLPRIKKTFRSVDNHSSTS